MDNVWMRLQPILDCSRPMAAGAAINSIRWQRAIVHAAVLFEFPTFV